MLAVFTILDPPLNTLQLTSCPLTEKPLKASVVQTSTVGVGDGTVVGVFVSVGGMEGVGGGSVGGNEVAVDMSSGGGLSADPGGGSCIEAGVGDPIGIGSAPSPWVAVAVRGGGRINPPLPPDVDIASIVAANAVTSAEFMFPTSRVIIATSFGGRSRYSLTLAYASGMADRNNNKSAARTAVLKRRDIPFIGSSSVSG